MIRALKYSGGALLCLAGLLAPDIAQAMCGCMVAPRPPRKQNVATPEIINESSKVALVRVKDTTVITMANDVKTKAANFAMIVPVPAKIRRKQVSVVNGQLFARLAQQTAPPTHRALRPGSLPPAAPAKHGSPDGRKHGLRRRTASS